MAADAPSVSSLTIPDEEMHPTSEKEFYDDETRRNSVDRPSLERIGSQNKSTEADIFAEPVVTAEADLEKGGVVPPSAVRGGINPADFRDRGLEAWLVG